MMNQTLERRILTLIAQTYALDFEKLNEVYRTVQSFDKVLSIIELSNSNNMTIENAYENWKN